MGRTLNGEGLLPFHCLTELEGKTLLLKTRSSSDKGYDLVRNDLEASSLMTSSIILQRRCTSCQGEKQYVVVPSYEPVSRSFNRYLGWQRTDAFSFTEITRCLFGLNGYPSKIKLKLDIVKIVKPNDWSGHRPHRRTYHCHFS